MTVSNVMPKTFSYQDLRKKDTMSPPGGMIRQKYPGADRVKKAFHNIYHKSYLCKKIIRRKKTGGGT